MKTPTAKVYTVMVADLFHYGHVEFLKRASALGDYLVVGVMSDERVAAYKRRPVMTLEERVEVVRACRYVDEVRVHDHSLDADWFRANGFKLKVHAIGTEQDRERKARRTPKPNMIPRLEVPYEHGISTTAIIQRILDRAGR